jgi:hypothetical protein
MPSATQGVHPFSVFGAQVPVLRGRHHGRRFLPGFRPLPLGMHLWQSPRLEGWWCWTGNGCCLRALHGTRCRLGEPPCSLVLVSFPFPSLPYSLPPPPFPPLPSAPSDRLSLASFLFPPPPRPPGCRWQVTDEIACEVTTLLRDTCEGEHRDRCQQHYDDNLKWIREAGAQNLVVGSQARILYSDAQVRWIVCWLW